MKIHPATATVFFFVLPQQRHKNNILDLARSMAATHSHKYRKKMSVVKRAANFIQNFFNLLLPLNNNTIYNDVLRRRLQD